MKNMKISKVVHLKMLLSFLKYDIGTMILPSLVSLTLLVINLLYPGPEVPGGLSVEKIL